jgi:hypothetical protein
MNEPFELPSLEEIQEMERLRPQAIESLQISGNSRSVKCQRCSNAIPIVGKLPHQHNDDRIAVLQNRIKSLEEHYNSPRFGSTETKNNLKKDKQELAVMIMPL